MCIFIYMWVYAARNSYNLLVCMCALKFVFMFVERLTTYMCVRGHIDAQIYFANGKITQFIAVEL